MADALRNEPPAHRVAVLLERDAERAALAKLVEDARAGRGACVVIRGPAGIGKSRLVEEALALSTAAGLRALTACGSELERDFAFGAVRQLFERELTDPDRRGALLDGRARLAAPALSVSADERVPEEAGHAVLHGLYWLASNLAHEAPLAIVVDDAHWLDAPSLRWLAYLCNRVEELAVALVVAARPEEDADVLRQISLHRASTTLTPRPLSETAVATLTALALAREPEPGFVRACAGATHGNPFYLHQLLGALARDGAAPTRSEIGRVQSVTPASVVDSVALRLARLHVDCTRLAQAVAVVEADARLAARLAGLEPAEAANAAEALARIEILRPSGDDFVHPLVRSAVIEAMPAREREELHSAAARLLFDADAPAERTAAQLLASPPGGGRWALRTLRDAAGAASARGAPDVAERFLRRALEEEPRHDERIELLRELGRATTATKGPDGLVPLREALDLADTPALRADVALELARDLFSLGFFGESAELLEAASEEAAVAAVAPAAALRKQLATISLLDLRTLKRLGGLSGIAALAQRDGDRDGVALATLAWVRAATEPPVDAAAELAHSALADPRLRPGEEPIAYGAAVVALWASDRLEDANAICSEVVESARATGALVTLRYALALRAIVLTRLGRIAAADADVNELVEWAVEHAAPFEEYRAALPWLITPLVDVLVERGKLDEAEQWVAVTDADAERPEVHGTNYLLEAIGRLRLAQGRVADAVALLGECGRRQEEWGIRNPAFMPWRSSLALAVAAAGDPARAVALCDEEIALARTFAVSRELGMALRAKALICGDRLELLRESVAVLEGSSASLEHARSLADLGAALRQRGRDTDARDPLRLAIDGAMRCGATALAERARDELVATGARPRRLAQSGAEALTAAELRAARLAAGGLTNRQIAEALYVTEKTVEGHLGRAYRKLGISSRTQLAAALDAAS